jgi:hypothetical protein
MPDNVINLYDTRVMLEYLRYEPGVARFLRDTFFPSSRVKVYATDSIDIEIERKGRPIACFVKRIEDGNLVKNSGYETNNFKTSYLSEFKEIKIDDFLRRQIGENPYDFTPPSVQAQQQFAQDLTDLVDRQNRAEEIMAAQVLTTGTFTGRDKDGKAIYEADFKMQASHKPLLTGDNLWNSDTIKKNDIMEQVRGWIVKLLQRDSGRMPTHLILGWNAFNEFLRKVDPDADIGGINSFRVVRGEVTPRMAEMGVFFLGTFPELANVQVVGYNEWYDDPWDGGETKPIFPANTALLLSSNARYDRKYGKINHLEAPDFIARWPWVWKTPNGKKRFVQVESAPLLSPFEIDSIVSATVTTDPVVS